MKRRSSKELPRRRVGLLVAFGAFVPANVSGIIDVRDGVQIRGMIADDLRSLTEAPVASPLLERCTPIYVPNHRPVPILAIRDVSMPPSRARSPAWRGTVPGSSTSGAVDPTPAGSCAARRCRPT